MSKTQTEATTAWKKRRPTTDELSTAAEDRNWWTCHACSHLETEHTTRCSNCAKEHEPELEPVVIFSRSLPGGSSSEYMYRAREIVGAVEDLVREICDVDRNVASTAVLRQCRETLGNHLTGAFDALELDGRRDRVL